MAHYLKEELYDLIKEDASVFDFIQEGSLDGIWYWDLEQPENEWMSKKFWTELGYDPQKQPHKASAWQHIINQDDLSTAVENFNRHCEDPEHPYDQTVRYTHKDGSLVYIRCRGLAIRDAEGKPIRMLGAHTNITAIKTLEEQRIKEREDLWRNTLHNIDIGFQIVDKDFRYVYLNKKTEKLSKYPPGSLIGKTMMEMYPGIEETEVFQAILEVMEKQEIKTIANTFTYPSGEIESFVNTFQPFNDGVCVITSDIPEEVKRINRQLQESKKRYSSIFETAKIPIVISDAEGNIVEFNSSANQQLGYSEDEYANLNLAEIDISKEHQSKLQQQNNNSGTNGFHAYQTSHLTKNGEKREMFVNESIIEIEGEQYNLSVFDDITEIKQTQIDLEEKNKELKQFAYIATHDIKAPITNIENYLNFLKSDKDITKERTLEAIEWIDKSVKQAQQTIQNLVTVTKEKNSLDLQLEEVDLHEMLKLAINELQSEITASQTQIHTNFSEIPTIKYDKAKAKSLILNLLSNAIKFRSPDRICKIEIRTALCDDFVSLSIHDNGLGIDLESDLEKVFGLFKRAHPKIPGSGIGLYMIKHSIESIGGKIEVESQIDKGSVFKVLLPK